jgi:hypothetical protein
MVPGGALVRELERETAPLATQETQPSEKAVTLIELVQRARNSTGQEQLWLATLVNQRLKKIGALPEPEKLVTFLLEQLDDQSFAGLKDKKGWPCRAAAVEAVIELGYPHALQLDPEDVEYLTQERLSRPTRLWPLTIASGLGLTGSVALGLLGVASTRSSGVDIVTAGITATGFLGLLFSHPRSAARRVLEVAGLAGSVLLGVSALIGGRALFHSPDAMVALGLASLSSVVLSFIESKLQPQ